MTSRDTDTATVRLHRSLYMEEAIAEAAETFAGFATFAVRADGSEQSIGRQAWPAVPSWSPDSATIVCQSDGEGAATHLLAIATDGSVPPMRCRTW